MDAFTEHCEPLLTGSYDCVDRVVLNAYFAMGHAPGGFRYWWRGWHGGSDSELDNTHLMRMAGRLSRRVRAFGKANGIPVIDCTRDERKHLIAEEYLKTHAVGTGLFLVLVASAPAILWDVKQSKGGVIYDIARKRSYVNHYSFHIWDPTWGHVVIKMAGHPPFDAQIMLNGHEFVTCQAQKAGISFTKEGNCFTAVPDPTALAEVADTLSRSETVGLLSQVCDRWIYSTCLCFALDADEQERSGFRYSYSVYQVEYSRNLLFRDGARMDRVFNNVVDRTRSRLDLPRLRTLFGTKKRKRSYKRDQELSLHEAVVIETPRWDLTIFKVHFGLFTLKGYTKGERVLRFEAIVHNTKTLRCGRTLDRFPEIVARLGAMTDRFTTMLDCVHIGFLPNAILDELPLPTTIGSVRVGGIDLNKPRMRHALAAVLALSVAPGGFTVADFADKVRSMTGQDAVRYSVRQAGYDLRKIRGKGLVVKPERTRRYQVPESAARTAAGLTVLRDQVLGPVLAGVQTRTGTGPPSTLNPIDEHYDRLQTNLRALLRDLGVTTGTSLAA